MPIVRFQGKILPTSAMINLEMALMTWGTFDLGFPLWMSGRIQNSIVDVFCKVERFEEKNLSVLFGRANDLVHIYVDMLAFATGSGLLVDLDMVIRPDGTSGPAIKASPELSALCTAYKIPAIEPHERADFAQVLQLIISETALMGSMMDLGYTLVFHHAAPTNCGRVLDSLRKGLSPKSKKKSGWAVLQEALNLDVEFINWISVYSTGSRHGERDEDIAHEVIDEIRKRTWMIVNRYIEYRKGGSVQLDKIKFPRLVHDPPFPFPKH